MSRTRKSAFAVNNKVYMRATKKSALKRDDKLKRPVSHKDERRKQALEKMKKNREERSKRMGVDRSDSFTKLRGDTRTATGKKTSATATQVSNTELYSPTVNVIKNKFRAHEGVIPEVKLDKKRDNKVKKIFDDSKKMVKLVESGIEKTAKTVGAVEQALSPYLRVGATVAQDSGHPMVAKGVMALDKLIKTTAVAASRGKDAFDKFSNMDGYKSMIAGQLQAPDVKMVDAVTPMATLAQ